MKRYLLSILLAAFAITGIGSYYVYGALNPYPDFRIVASEGDGDLLDGLKLSGFYAKQNGFWRYAVTSVEVTTEGSEYEFERSLFKKRNRHPLEAELDRSAHGFLRGKLFTPVNFYVDDGRIIYATTNAKPISRTEREVTAELETLDLDSGERTKFAAVLEPGTRESWPYLADVQRIGDEIHLFVELESRYKIYVLTTDGKLVRTVDVPAAFGQKDGDGENKVRISLAANHRPHAPKGVVGIQVFTYGTADADGNRSGQEVGNGGDAAGEPNARDIDEETDGEKRLSRVDLYVYDYAEERIRPVGGVDTADALEAHGLPANQMTDAYHHLVWHDGNRLRIRQISLADGSVRSFDFTSEQIGGSIADVVLQSGKAYVLASSGYAQDVDYTVAVIDLDSATVDAKAKVAENGRTVAGDSGVLDLYRMTLAYPVRSTYLD